MYMYLFNHQIPKTINVTYHFSKKKIYKINQLDPVNQVNANSQKVRQLHNVLALNMYDICCTILNI